MSSSKSALRKRLLADRAALPDAVRADEARAFAEAVTVAAAPGDVVCCYLPVGTEPGSPAMLDALRAAGVTVWLPVTRTGDDGGALPLRWGDYHPDRLVAGRWGLREPAPPWHDAEALAAAAAVVVPALAVSRTGVRLGRGGGFYDRSLVHADPAAHLIAVVRDEELLDEVPGEAHDVAMSHALTPRRGLVALDTGGG